MAQVSSEKQGGSPPPEDEKKVDGNEEAIKIEQPKEARPQREATFNDYLVGSHVLQPETAS